MRARRLLAALIALAVGLSLAGCADESVTEPTPRPVTGEEAQLLAITRFTNFDRGSRPFHTEITVTGVASALQGWVDYGSQLGYAAVTGAFGAEALLWTGSSVGAIARDPDAGGNPVLPIPDTSDPGWQIQHLDPAVSPLFALLAAIGALGQDRPDNPLLLQQAGAMWLRTDEVDDAAVTVFAAPPDDEPLEPTTAPADSPLRLWVDADGLLRRAELHLNNTWNTVDFPDVAAPRLELPTASD